MTDAEGRGGLPWRRLMRLGLGILRLSPREFWGMTPKELEAALAGAFGDMQQAPMSKTALGALMARYPDREKAHGGRD